MFVSNLPISELYIAQSHVAGICCCNKPKLSFVKAILLLIHFFATYNSSVLAIWHPQSDSVFVLHAAKEKYDKSYLPGDYLKIEYTGVSGIVASKGRLLKVLKDSIDILPFGNRKPGTRVAIAAITAIEKLHEKSRRGWKIAIPVLILMVVLGAISKQILLIVVLFLPGVTGLFYLLMILIFSFLADRLSRKSVAKGWRFYSGKEELKKHLFKIGL